MIIETTLGKIQGVDQGDYIEFRGVPFAQPPVGALRWKAPQPIEPWEGILKAEKFPPKAVQFPMGGFYLKEFYENPEYEQEMSEDCLYLNIWMPKEKSESPRPVAFWIHGGGFICGGGSEMEFDGAEYCKRGVILVSVQYRCNIFGFLAHPQLDEENELHISGNYGCLDQIAALQWVHENIEAFGGDAGNITVFGQSAGAMSTQTLISSPLTKDWIAKAILQSGGGYANGLNRDDITLEFQEKIGSMFFELANVTTIQELRGMSSDQIFSFMPAFLEKAMPFAGGLFMLPTIDGNLLTDNYSELIDKMEIKNIPYLFGATKDDELVTPELKAEGKKGPLYDGCISFGEKLLKAGRKAPYIYYFTRDLPGDEAGAFHSSELWYMFGTYPRCWRPMTEADAKLSEKMLDYWTNFMKTGNPNRAGENSWKAFDGTESSVKILDVE